MTETEKGNPVLTSKQIVDLAAISATQKKAENIITFNPGSQSELADWLLICQGNNEIHNKAIAQAIQTDLNEKGSKPWQKEGLEQGRWILLDYSDVVVNIMLPEIREYYQLEDLWQSYPNYTHISNDF